MKNKMSAAHSRKISLNYDNTPMQYTVLFHDCKIGNFFMINCDIFNIFAENINMSVSVSIK